MPEEREGPIDLSEGVKTTTQEFEPTTPAQQLMGKDKEDGTRLVSSGNGKPSTQARVRVSEDRTLDPEVSALQVMLDALENLEPEQRARVLRYAAARSVPGFIIVPVGTLLGG